MSNLYSGVPSSVPPQPTVSPHIGPRLDGGLCPPYLVPIVVINQLQPLLPWAVPPFRARPRRDCVSPRGGHLTALHLWQSIINEVKNSS
eukprot:scaffold34752_cov72-Cyclotella_meneghiniana.AAC.4